MAEADRRTIAAGTPVETLMDRAGRAVAWEIRRRLDGVYGRRAVVVCGKGNNGGDGLVTAAVLTGWGVAVDVVELATPPPADTVARALARADVLVDAMYGTGFTGRLEGIAADVATASAAHLTVAVDIPSGIDGRTGAADGPAVQATTTVTFAAHKPGLLFEPGRAHAGVVRVADIGIDVGAPALQLLDVDDARDALDAQRASGRYEQVARRAARRRRLRRHDRRAPVREPRRDARRRRHRLVRRARALERRRQRGHHEGAARHRRWGARRPR